MNHLRQGLGRRAFIASGAALALTTLSGHKALAENRLAVTTSFSILRDMVQVIGGDKVDVTSLIGPGADAHGFQPRPSDALALRNAKLIFINGIGFEPWFDRLKSASGTKARVVSASRYAKLIKLKDHDHGHDHGHDHDHHGEHDPHAWQDLDNAAEYVVAIAQALGETDRLNIELYKANAFAYTQALAALHASLKARFALLPAAKKRIVTSHDAFAYFGRAYGLTFLSPVGVSTQKDASPRDVARLIDQIKREKISAVFVEAISDPRLIEQIARDTGASVGGTLYSDALSDAKGPASTYLQMMKHNGETILKALGSTA